MIPSAVQANFSDHFSATALPVLEEVFRSNIERHPQVRDMILRKVPHDREIWQYSEIHDMPLFSSISEGTDYSLSSQKQGYDKTLTIIKYGLGFSISEEAVEDGKFPFIADAVAKLAKSARETQEQSGMDLLNNGFTTTTTADGKALFALDHNPQAASSVVIANRPAVNADLSFSSLSDAISEFKKTFRGDSGIFQMIMPKYLVVPTELEMYARQLVQSSLEADSNNNNINPFHLSLQVVASPHLTDTDAWFLLSDPSEHGLVIIERKGIETKAGGSDIGFLNDSIIYKARYREQVGALRPNGAYGSPGA
jgi:phage major head subunit gpT-like protein